MAKPKPTVEIQTFSDAAVLRGQHPWLPGGAFINRPGLAEQVAQLVEKYDQEHG